MKNRILPYLIAFIIVAAFTNCQLNTHVLIPINQSKKNISASKKEDVIAKRNNKEDADRMFFQSISQHEIPVLCYHQVREWKATDSKTARTYIIPPLRFMQHMKILADSGYHFVLPQDIADYIKNKNKPPRKSCMISFDDGTEGQYTTALPVLNTYGFKGVFFIMTVVLNKPGYLTKEQVIDVSKHGHVIACHTWDHHNVTGYTEKDWQLQLQQPTAALEKMIRKPVNFFAYPNGIWNSHAISDLKKQGYTAAFQLAEKQDVNEPAFTIRRIIADSHWSGPQLIQAMEKAFK
ncbi:hypothetical protein BH10BAC3_BH10BAC3_32790 [soil metagenome]